MPTKRKPLLEPDEELDDLYESGSSAKTPFAYRFMAAFLALLLIFLSIQGVEYFLHPAPSDVPTLADIRPFVDGGTVEGFSSYSPKELSRILDETGSIIKEVANKISSASCKSGDRVCQSKALFQFVRDNIIYVSDAKFHDQLQNPLTTLKTGGADCEDMAVLLGALQKAIGNDARLAFIPGHAYLQVFIPEYKNHWIGLEATCKTCKFGEVPTDNQLQPTEFQGL